MVYPQALPMKISFCNLSLSVTHKRKKNIYIKMNSCRFLYTNLKVHLKIKISNNHGTTNHQISKAYFCQESENASKKVVRELTEKQKLQNKSSIIPVRVIERDNPVPVLKIARIPNETQKIVKNRQEIQCDLEIFKHLESHDLNSALDTLKFLTEMGTYPSKKTLKLLVKRATNQLSLPAIQLVSSVLAKAYPKDYSYEMGYNHFIAEFYWKSGDYQTAIDLFESLLNKYPRTKKICDMMMFMSKNIVANELTAELNYLTDMSARCAKQHIYKPDVDLWFLLITSISELHHYFAGKIFESLPVNETTRKAFQNKVNSVLQIASTENRKDLVQNIIPILATLKLTSETSQAYCVLLKIYCDNEDTSGVLRTFHHACEQKIILSANVFQMISSYIKGS